MQTASTKLTTGTFREVASRLRHNCYVACEMTGASGVEVYHGCIPMSFDFELRIDLMERCDHWCER